MIPEIVPAIGETTHTTDKLVFDAKAQAKLRHLKSLPAELLADEVGKLLCRMTLADSRAAKANNAKIRAACASGLRIEAAKLQLGHGEYLLWLKTCGPGISEDTAERQRKLAANSARVRNLAPGTTLNQAYRILGITRAPLRLDPIQQLRRDLLKVEPSLKGCLRAGEVTEPSVLAKEIRAHISKCEKLARTLEESVLMKHRRDDALCEWACDCILAGLWRRS